jgi:glutamate 5-kinase
LAHAVLPQGTLQVDDGAAQALIHRGASLLAVGIRAVDGRFERHQPVRVLGGDGREIGRGLVTLGSEELEGILGLDRAAIHRKLGEAGDTVIHRDHFVLTPAAPDPPPP